jgi:hypothetical protein
MAKDLTVELENRPGTLGELGEALGNAGVNIDGVAAVAVGPGTAPVHVLVDNHESARQALEEAGLKVTDERDVFVLSVLDQPGELGRITKSLGEAGINVDLVYLTATRDLVLGVDDLEKTRSLLP